MLSFNTVYDFISLIEMDAKITGKIGTTIIFQLLPGKL